MAELVAGEDACSDRLVLNTVLVMLAEEDDDAILDS
jgi:hypothetical protein